MNECWFVFVTSPGQDGARSSERRVSTSAQARRSLLLAFVGQPSCSRGATPVPPRPTPRRDLCQSPQGRQLDQEVAPSTRQEPRHATRPRTWDQPRRAQLPDGAWPTVAEVPNFFPKPVF